VCRERGGCKALASTQGGPFCRYEGLASPFFLEWQGFCSDPRDVPALRSGVQARPRALHA
jgi:hypothetical protein